MPASATVAAAFGLDLLWPILLLLGLESVRVNPGDTAFTNLAFDSYPWSHSLVATVVWAALAGALGRILYGSARAAVLLGALVASHWVLDFVTHRPDLPLWPGGPEYGLSLWNSVAGTIVGEGGLYVAGVWLYLRTTRAKDGTGRWALAALLALVGLLWIAQPWSPPPPSATAVAWGALILWVVPFWVAWAERHRTAAGGGAPSGPGESIP